VAEREISLSVVFAWMAVFLWLVVALASALMVWGDNPTAINGVIGAGLAATLCTVLAWISRDGRL